MTGMGTSPFPLGQSPSHHSTSYIPKFEANYLTNFTCCDLVFGGLHELLQHQEENHSAKGAGTRRASASRPRPSVTTGGGVHGLRAPQGQQQRTVGGSGMGIQQRPRPQPQTPVAVPQKHVPAAQM